MHFNSSTSCGILSGSGSSTPTPSSAPILTSLAGLSANAGVDLTDSGSNGFFRFGPLPDSDRRGCRTPSSRSTRGDDLGLHPPRSIMDGKDQPSLYSYHLQNVSNGNPAVNGHTNNTHTHPAGGSSPSLHYPPPHHHGAVAYAPPPPQPHPHHLPTAPTDLLSPAAATTQPQPFSASLPSPHANSHGHSDLHKVMPTSPLDVYQPPPSSSSSHPQDPLNLTDRHLDSHSPHFQLPHHHAYNHAHAQYQPSPSASSPSYHYTTQQQPQQQPQQQQQQLPPQHYGANGASPAFNQYHGQHADPTAPGSKGTPTISPGPSASPAAMPSGNFVYHPGNYSYIGALSPVHRQSSPTGTFHVPASPSTPTGVPHMASPPSNHPIGVPLAMPPWAASNSSPVDQGMQPRQVQQQQPQQQQQQQQQQQPQQEQNHALFSHAMHSQHPQQSQQPTRDSVNHAMDAVKEERPSGYHPGPPPSAHSYSPDQQPSQIWVPSMSSDYASQSFSEHPERPQSRHARSFDAAGNPMQDASYAVNSGSMDQHGVIANERSRMHPARNPALVRGLMDYNQNYAGHGQGPPLASPSAGVAVMGGLPLLSPTVMQPNPQGHFPSMQLLQSNNGAKAISTSLDTVPMGLGPPTIISHPEYGAVASYNPTPTSSSASKARPGMARIPPQRSQSVNGPFLSMQKNHVRNNSVASSSSIASSGAMSSITTSLNATSISFPDSSPKPNYPGNAISANTAASTPNAGATMVTTDHDGGSQFLIDASKARLGGHPRKATAARIFECSIAGCNKAYTQLHNLKSHERTGHTPVTKHRPFLCVIAGCTKAFSQRKSLALHIKANHQDFKFKPFKCSQPSCHKAYTQLHNLRTHEKTVHMLDLSKKRVRNPLPSSGQLEDGSGGVMGSSNDLSMGGAGVDDALGTQGSNSQSSMPPSLHPGQSPSSKGPDYRNSLATQVGLSYESVGDLQDYGVEKTGGEGDYGVEDKDYGGE